MLLVKNETKGWKTLFFCLIYEIVCMLLVKPYKLELLKQNYTVVDAFNFHILVSRMPKKTKTVYIVRHAYGEPHLK